MRNPNQLPTIFNPHSISPMPVVDFLRNHWFKISLMLVILLVFKQKEMNFQFSLGNSSITNAESALLTPTPSPPPEMATMDLDESAILPFVTKKQKRVKNSDEKSEKTNTGNVANTFSNLGFILNPNYAAKHGVAADIVEKHNAACRNYIREFSGIAVREMHDFGVPASITLAQGLLESNAGGSFLSEKANNHFGIKCFSKSCRKGHCINATDDTHKDFFKKYASAAESFRDHSLFLQKDRYKGLKRFGKRDYSSWARGLKAAGYATDPRYGEKLIRIIEVLKLDYYDKL
jgi:flagellum-specific peptidoglycan hydrolase FlgJ